jgi:Ni2+-binding GTPase involved in maturation of urease and hydrogenase
MSKKPKMFFVGGFLGAGKTTAIQALAKIFAEKGLKAAAITNDQAAGLVDTVFLANSGIPAEEVPGSCFCCNFNGLAQAINHSISEAAPDVILAEPVGSCTDIVATVIRPMRHLMKDKVEVLAYSVLVEPDRWFELSAKGASWSMKYLFDKQIEEADFMVITKLDTLTGAGARELLEEAARLHPEPKVLGISALKGEGMENWMHLVQTTAPGEHWLRDIDYQRYAEAEAEMGWLNGLVTLTFPGPIDGKLVSVRMVERLTQGIGARHGSIGHLKLLAVGSTGSVKVGVTQVGEKPVLEGAFTLAPLSQLQVIINMRATLSPGDLAAIVHEAAGHFQIADQAEVDISAINTFRPGAPQPTYRYREATGS